jgi:hypothetical protein
LLAGLSCWGYFLFGQLWGGAAPALGMAAKAFIPVWLAISVANLWVGVNKAGCAVTEELPILLLVFAVPAVVAGIVMAIRPPLTAGMTDSCKANKTSDRHPIKADDRL